MNGSALSISTEAIARAAQFPTVQSMDDMIEIVRKYLTIISQAGMGSESIAHEAEDRMGYWLRGHEGERNNNIVLVKSN